MKNINIKKGKIYQYVYNRKYDDRNIKKIHEPPKASIIENNLTFESDELRNQAYSEGFFLLEIPENLRINELDQLNKDIFLNVKNHLRHVDGKALKDELLGYHARSNQIEQFLMESRYWKRYFSESKLETLFYYKNISSMIISDALRFSGIPEIYHKEGTGGCLSQGGTYHITFNHYRSTINSVGLGPHKDDGFVTILRTTSPGLEINRYDQWESIEPNPDYFIINFGLTMELLTQSAPKPLHSIFHRVSQQNNNRFSFGFFASSRCHGHDAGIYTYKKNEGLIHVCSSRELIKLNDYEIYEGTEKP